MGHGPLQPLSPTGWLEKKKPLPFLYHDCHFLASELTVLFYE